ncbi:MAG: AAA family ATPase [Candidatus Gracilibacteria bacterium]|nr:AAA family ATPase [Candidatus Gracilibacteria bacterium]
MKPSKEEINNTNENSINADINLLLRDEIFTIPDIYKQDYRGKSDEEQIQMMKNFIKKHSSKKEENKENKKGEKFDDVIDFKEVRFTEVDKGNGEIEYIEGEKPKHLKNNKKVKDDTLYSFKIEELLELERYLKIKILGQNHIIEQYISNFMLNTYRNENNDKNLGVFFNFGPSGSGKNYLCELIAEKLDFGIFIIDLSQFHRVELNSLLGATDGYSSNDNSIMENINNISQKHNGKMILIFDEIEKGMNSENGNINTFFTTIMNIINNKEVYTKNNSTKVDLSNFIFVFNSNLGYDQYENKLMSNYNKIGFDIGENKKTKIEKKNIDSDFIEDYFKNKLKINISVFNRLNRGNNFFFFNHLKKSLFNEYLEKEFRNLKIELCYNFNITWEKLPNLDKFNDKIKKFDYTKGFRGINDIIYIEIKLFIMKNYIFKNQFKKGKLVGLRK